MRDFPIGWLSSRFLLANLEKSFQKPLQIARNSSVLNQLPISKLNYVIHCSFFTPFINKMKSLDPSTDMERHCEKLSSSALFSYLLVPWEDLGFHTTADPFRQETPIREWKLKCNIFFPNEVEYILKYWTFFFFHWQVKTPSAKWKRFRVLKLLSFVYLVSAWVIFTWLKILQEGDLKRDLASTQHLEVLRYLGGKGITQ